MTTEEFTSERKTWAELAEEEDEEIGDCGNTVASESLDQNEVYHQPLLTKSTSEFHQSKSRNQGHPRNKQRNIENNNSKQFKTRYQQKQKTPNYNQEENHYQHHHRQQKESKNHFEDTLKLLQDSIVQEVIIKVKPQNKQLVNLDSLKQHFEEHFEEIKCHNRKDIVQLDILVSPKIAIEILEKNSFKTTINDIEIALYYPQEIDEPLPLYYANKKKQESERKQQHSANQQQFQQQCSAPQFQRSSITSKQNKQNQQDQYEDREEIKQFQENDSPMKIKNQENDYSENHEQHNNNNNNNNRKYHYYDNNKTTNYKNSYQQRNKNYQQQDIYEEKKEFKNIYQQQYHKKKERKQHHEQDLYEVKTEENQNENQIKLDNLEKQELNQNNYENIYQEKDLEEQEQEQEEIQQDNDQISQNQEASNDDQNYETENKSSSKKKKKNKPKKNTKFNPISTNFFGVLQNSKQ